MDTTFWIGVAYRPRGARFAWWERVDRGALREELAQVRTFGVDVVRLDLDWAAFQPSAERIGSTAMRGLETVLDAAAEAGLHTLPVLFPAYQDGALSLPRWVLRPDPVAQLRRAQRGQAARRATRRGAPAAQMARRWAMVDGGWRTFAPRDVFNEPEMIEAFGYLINEVCGYFGSHPVVHAWQIGAGLDMGARPGPAAAEHLARLVEQARQASGDGTIVVETSGRALDAPGGLDVPNLVATGAQVSVALEPAMRLAAGAHLADRVEATHALAAGLAERRVLVSGLGVAAQAGTGEPRIPDALAADVQAEVVGEALDQLWQAGAAGVTLAAYADVPVTQWRLAPHDRAVQHRTRGLVDAAGREKPLTGVVRDFAQRAAGVLKPLDVPAVDVERRRRGERG